MPLRPWDNSIKKTFSITIGWVLIFGTIALSITIAANEGLNQYHILEKKGLSFAHYIAKLGQDPLITGDNILLDSIVNESQQDNEILYSVIYDARGEIVTSQFASINYKSSRIREIKSDFANASDLAGIIARIKAKEATFEVTAPIVTGNQTIGRVVIGLSKHNILHNIFVTVSVVIALNIAIALILAILLFQVSGRIVFTPLAALAEAAHRLARGDLDTRISAPATGEILLLMESFNQMASDLQKTTVSRQYMDDIIRSMTEALVIVAQDLTIKDVNPATTTLTGYTAEELLGRQAAAFMETAPLQQIASTTATSPSISTESCCRAKDGKEIPVHLTASAILSADGAIQGFVCNILDISPLRQVTRQLETANEALTQEIEQRRRAQEISASLNEDLERQKSALQTVNLELESFCYSVSHDLRAPLRHINGYTSILSTEYRNCLDKAGQEFLSRICTASNRMGLLIDDLLSFSRVSRTEMRRMMFNLSSGAAQVVEMLQSLEPERRVEVVIAPGLTALGDSTLLQLVLQNLIGNAWKYTSRTPAARIEIGRTSNRGREAFFVRDNGIGFDMTYHHKLFRVFERLHGSDFEGTGIGLATVQRIILRHGGDIWAEGELGKGAVFYFTLSSSDGLSQH